MVLAIIVGIGSNYFQPFTASLQGTEPDIGKAMSLVLASLALFGLGIFGPGIASGLVAGAPQPGAGSALGTVLGAGEIGRAHVCTPVTNSHLVCLLLLDKKKTNPQHYNHTPL